MIVYLHFEELLEIYNSVSVLVSNDICPEIMKDIFPLSTCSSYDIRSKRTFTTRSVKIVYYGTESLSYLAPKVWELILNNIKSLENLPKFKKATKKWKPDVRPCRPCRSYIPQNGFV